MYSDVSLLYGPIEIVWAAIVQWYVELGVSCINVNDVSVVVQYCDIVVLRKITLYFRITPF